MKKLNVKNLYEIIDRNLERTLDELYSNELDRIYKEYCIAYNVFGCGVCDIEDCFSMTNSQREFFNKFIEENDEDPIAYFLQNFSGRFAEDPEEKELCEFIVSLGGLDIEKILFELIERCESKDKEEETEHLAEYFTLDEEDLFVGEEYLCPAKLMRNKKKGGE